MGSARLQGKKLALEQGQKAPAPSQGSANSTGKGTSGGGVGRMFQRQLEPSPARGLDNQAQGTGVANMFKPFREAHARRAREQAAAAAALSAAEKTASQKTAELANSAGGGLSISTDGRGNSSYTEGNPGQDDSQSQGDVDLSTSDTTLRRRGGYRRDAGVRI